MESQWKVELRFNSRLRGANQTHTAVVDALGIDGAIFQAAKQALQLPEHGQSIVITGATLDVVPEDVRLFLGRQPNYDNFWHHLSTRVLNALQRHGEATPWNLSVAKLIRIPGIGPDSIKEIAAAAEKCCV